MINPNYRLLVVSTSTIYGSGYLEYIREEVIDFLKTDELLFIPFARPSGISHDDYTQNVVNALEPFGIKVSGLHTYNDPKEAVRNAKAIFIGGGNTFLLLKTLYELGLVDVIREVVANGVPYMGSSAGSNMTGLTIGTTNDMPIVYPPSFNALQFLPFNINPHYLDPDPNSTHKGETRETRINEFHKFNSQSVIGLREGSWLRVENGEIELKGTLKARIFKPNEDAIEVESGKLSATIYS
ncbi:dipeptidase E [Chishuiella changwenlii]|uniref:dipeptidase E n=1 Tax=Chishuiella changwenlii TaxID=1434701 RepID=A0A1M7AR49_9FLAO|nr:dipeptidase PepE [Chishuiella changwenlii]GGE91048.1 dipeptidase E [Chishuiella changwenlii]SHL45250.1 dipeptidase E [Chishuiella changwenlii]